MEKYGRGKHPNSHKSTAGRFTSESLLGNTYARGKKQSPETIEKRRVQLIGHKTTQETRNRISAAKKGKPFSIQHKQKLSNAQLGKPRPWRIGEKAWNWKGGTKSVRQKMMISLEYKSWRKHVFNRDSYTCQGCGERGGHLEADHELPFSMYPDLRLEILNGRTFCRPCHKRYGWKGNSHTSKYGVVH